MDACGEWGRNGKVCMWIYVMVVMGRAPTHTPTQANIRDHIGMFDQVCLAIDTKCCNDWCPWTRHYSIVGEGTVK